MKKLPSLAIVWVELLVACFSLSGVETNAPGEAQFLSNIWQLTFEGRRSGEGYFSPDGKALIFQSERETGNPFYQIYILDLETGDSHRVSAGIGKTTCAFFRPNTDEVLFASTHLDPEAKGKQKTELELRASGKERRYSWDYDEHFDIFVAKRDGSRLRRLTSAYGYDAEASYSPNGKKIVFTSLRDAYPAEKLSSEDRKRLENDPAYFGEIYIMNADGSGQNRLTFTPGHDGFDGLPVFSPDGRRLCWTSNRTPDGKSQLFLADWDDKAALAALKTSPERGAGAGVLPALRPRERPGVEAHKAVPPPHVGG